MKLNQRFLRFVILSERSKSNAPQLFLHEFKPPIFMANSPTRHFREAEANLLSLFKNYNSIPDLKLYPILLPALRNLYLYTT